MQVLEYDWILFNFLIDWYYGSDSWCVFELLFIFEQESTVVLLDSIAQVSIF